MQRILRTTLVSMLVLAMSFNPAAAWHHFRGGGYAGGYSGGYCGGGGCGGYGGYYGHGGSCMSGYCGWSGYHGADGCGYYGYSRVAYDSCGGGCDGYGSCGDGGCGGCDSCGDGSYGGCDGCGTYDGYDSVGGTVIESSPHVYDVAPEAPSEVYSEPMPQYAPPSTTTPPTDTARPTLPAEPAPMPSDRSAEPLPPTPSTEDSLFGETPETTTPPARTTPEATPATPPPAEDNGLFDSPTTEPATPPAETPATPPAEAPAEDDFFSTETSPPAGATDITPVDTPAESAATEGTADELFGEQPAATGTTESQPAAPAGESTAPTGESTPSGEGLDDMFGPEGARTLPAAPNSTTPRSQTSFGATESVLGEPGGLASSEMRMWVDNTGRYSCRGRLVRFLDGKVRLMKENGRTTTVPLYRLSADDLAFVHRQASAQPAETFAQAVSTETAEMVTAN